MHPSAQVNQFQNLLKALIFFLFILIVAILACIFFIFRQQKIQEQASQRRFESRIIAEEMRQSSDDLTRLARTYVITRDTLFRNQYVEVLKIRRGLLPRPVNYSHAYWDLRSVAGFGPPNVLEEAISLRAMMEAAGFSKEELRVLSRVESYSDTLSLVEMNAFNLMDAEKERVAGFSDSDFQEVQFRAIELLHDKSYHLHKMKIMKELNLFFKLLDSRTHEDVIKQSKNLQLMVGLVLCLFLLCIVNLLGLLQVNSKFKNEVFRDLNSQVKQRTLELLKINAEHEAQNEEYIQLNEELKQINETLLNSQANLAASEIKYRNLVENSQVGVFQTKLNGDLVYVNNALIQALEYDLSENLIGKSSLGLYKNLRQREEFIDQIRKKGNVSRYEMNFITKKGNERIVLISATLNRDVIDGTVVDISSLKEVEDALRKERTLLRSIMETSPVGIVTLDRDGNITYANSRGIQILGLTKDHVTQLTYNAPVWKITDFEGKPFPEQELPFVKVMTTKLPCYDVQHAIEQDDGTRIILSINAAPIVDESGQFNGMIASIENISDRKTAEIKIQQQNQELTRLNRNKDKFFSILMHDIRGPLASIHQLSQILNENHEDYDEQELKNTLEIFEKVTGQTFNLLENLIEWSRVQQGKTLVNLQKQNLKSLITDELTFLEEIAKQKNITILNKALPNLAVNCDKNLSSTILRNLIVNAIKFSPEKGKISLNTFQTGAFAEIQVIDEGIGIAADRLPDLFDFEKNRSTPGTAKEKGTGLGLPLCKEFVEIQGGKISVQSEPGKGTAFTFTLPLA